MAINNTALYDSVIAGIALSNYSWITDANPADYDPSAAVAIAIEVDSLIAPIAGGATMSQRDLICSITKSAFLTRNPIDVSPSDYAGIAQAIAAMFTSYTAQLQDPNTGVAPPAPFVYMLDSSADPIIPHYLQLTPSPSYTPGAEATIIASGADGVIAQFAIAGNPISWIAQAAIGVPFINAGEWAANIFASVTTPLGNTNIRFSFYTRATGGAETHLFDITTPKVTLNTVTQFDRQIIVSNTPVDPTDRLVLKAFGQNLAAPTNVTLFYQGSVNASHIHTTIQP